MVNNNRADNKYLSCKKNLKVDELEANTFQKRMYSDRTKRFDTPSRYLPNIITKIPRS